MPDAGTGIFLFPKVGGDPFAPTFEFDAELSEKRTDEYQWTEHAVEAAADIAQHGRKRPIKLVVTGRVTMSPFDPDLFDADRPGRIHDALVKLADLRQIVTLVTGTWVIDVVITKVEASRDNSTGFALHVQIEFQTVARPEPATVRIPPSRLRPKVRRRGPPTNKGGTSAKTTPGGKKRKSAAAKIVDFARR